MATNPARADARATSSGAPHRAALDFVVRPVGREQALLGCDFSSPDRPALITTLLGEFLTMADGAPIEAIELWNLPVSTRHLALVRIACELEDATALVLSLRCPHGNCGEFLEVPLAIDALTAMHDEHAAQEILVLAAGTGVGRWRRPNGDDLQRWRTSALIGAAPAAEVMLRDLLLAGEAPGNAAPLAEAFESFDPLLAFVLTTECPACRRRSEHAVDLEEIALARLRLLHARLLREVHQLAQAYGWNESEIMGVPARRRASYIELIGEGSTA